MDTRNERWAKITAVYDISGRIRTYVTEKPMSEALEWKTERLERVSSCISCEVEPI